MVLRHSFSWEPGSQQLYGPFCHSCGIHPKTLGTIFPASFAEALSLSVSLVPGGCPWLDGTCELLVQPSVQLGLHPATSKDLHGTYPVAVKAVSLAGKCTA